MVKKIVIKGAKEHNLKNISLEIPKDKFIVITGLSGSGKSSLAFDTIYAEGQRRYVESLSAYARQFLDKMKKPKVDLIEGLSPAISIEQKNTSKNPRSTVATVTEIYDYMRVLYARAGTPYSPFTGKPIKYIGTGEKMHGLEVFHPDRVSSRILGMGDVLTLVEKAQKEVEISDAEEMQKKLQPQV